MCYTSLEALSLPKQGKGLRTNMLCQVHKQQLSMLKVLQSVTLCAAHRKVLQLLLLHAGLNAGSADVGDC